MTNRLTLTTAVLALGAYAGVVEASHIQAITLGAGRSGGVRTDSSVPIEAGHWSFGVSFENSGFDRLSEEELLALRAEDAEASLHSVDTIIALGFDVAYGLTHDITIGVHVPFIARDDIIEAEHEGISALIGGPVAAQTHLEGIEALGKSSGLGDVSLYGLWRFYQSAATDTSVGLLAGIKVPTGADDNHADTGELFESEFQPGSGSWDPFAGLAWSRGIGQFTLAASSVYTLATEGSQNTDLGDQWIYNAGAGYKLGTFDGATWSIVLELNGGWRDQEQIGSETNANSGGTWLYLSPGLTISGKRWAVYASYSQALDAELDGHQDDLDYRALLGFSFSR